MKRKRVELVDADRCRLVVIAIETGGLRFMRQGFRGFSGRPLPPRSPAPTVRRPTWRRDIQRRSVTGHLSVVTGAVICNFVLQNRVACSARPAPRGWVGWRRAFKAARGEGTFVVGVLLTDIYLILIVQKKNLACKTGVCRRSCSFVSRPLSGSPLDQNP